MGTINIIRVMIVIVQFTKNMMALRCKICDAALTRDALQVKSFLLNSYIELEFNVHLYLKKRFDSALVSHQNCCKSL